MTTSQFVCIISCTIAVYLLVFGLSFIFIRKKIIYFKAMLFGTLIYFIARGFLIPILSRLLQPIFPNHMNYISLIIVIVFAILMKVYLYPFFFHKNPSMKNYLSAGFGEGLTEAILSIFPVFSNALAYSMKIQDGSIYTFFSKAYSETEISNIVETFLSTPNSYYIYIVLSAVFLIVINVVLAYMLYKKQPMWLIFIATSVLFIINIVLPSYSYLAYIIIMLLLTGILYVKSDNLCCLLE